MNQPGRSHKRFWKCPGNHEHRCMARRGHGVNASVKQERVQVTGRCTTDDERRRGSAGGDPPHEPAHCHDSAPSRHAYSTPTRRITMNINISTNAVRPSRTYTTAHGYMKTISMSNARKSTAMA